MFLPLRCCCRAKTLPALANSSGVAATWTEPDATDNVGVARIEKTHAPGATFDVAASPTLVVYRAVDASGLSSTCNFTVTVTRPVVPLTLAVTVGQSGLSTSSQVTDAGLVVYSDHLVNETTQGLETIATSLVAFNRLAIRIQSPATEEVSPQEKKKRRRRK